MKGSTEKEPRRLKTAWGFGFLYGSDCEKTSSLPFSLPYPKISRPTLGKKFRAFKASTYFPFLSSAKYSGLGSRPS